MPKRMQVLILKAGVRNLPERQFRRAVSRWGIHIMRKIMAHAGFTAIGTYEMPREGDVIIIQPYAGGNPSGHMAIYDGAEWYSDFKQRDMWAGPGYRAARPSYTIYRKN